MRIKMGSFIRVMLVVGAFAVMAHAQDEGHSSLETNAALEHSIGGLLQPESLAFSPELARTNYLDGGINVGTTFDDNALSTETNHVSNFNYSVMPHIALRQSRGRVGWKINYAAGFVASERYSSLNQGTHKLDVESVYRISPHVTFTLRDNFAMTTGFFDQLNQGTDMPAGTVLQRPNQSVVTPLAKQTANLATGLVAYQFSNNSEIGASGTSYLSRFHDEQGGASLVDTDSQEAEVFYNHRVFGRDSLGVTYRFQRFTFSSLANDSLVHSVLATFTWRPHSNLAVSFFAGPQYRDSSSQFIQQTATPQSITLAWVPESRNAWSTAAGSSLNWNGERTSFLANAARTINDGGGLLGAVELTSVDAAIRRQLTQVYSAQIGVTYGRNRALVDSAAPYSSVNGTIGSISLSRRFGTSFGFTAGYARAHQTQDSVSASNLVNNNRAWVSLSYDFSRPLGR